MKTLRDEAMEAFRQSESERLKQRAEAQAKWTERFGGELRHALRNASIPFSENPAARQFTTLPIEGVGTNPWELKTLAFVQDGIRLTIHPSGGLGILTQTGASRINWWIVTGAPIKSLADLGKALQAFPPEDDSDSFEFSDTDRIEFLEHSVIHRGNMTLDGTCENIVTVTCDYRGRCLRTW